MAGHVLRNSVGAALSMTGLQVGLMFSGVLVVEQVFGWPGIGQYIAQSIPVADFPAIAGRHADARRALRLHQHWRWTCFRPPPIHVSQSTGG